MAGNNYFKFKQFTVWQEKAAMKVGTEGILLGAWVGVENCNTILDIGTGTGLIALMLAQRSKAQITAIEIEENAAIEAKQNVEKSDWSNRIDVQNISFQTFAENASTQFDVIVSNPPFFSNNLKAKTSERNLARHNDSLPFSELISYSVKLLSSAGKLAVVLPLEPASEFEKLAYKNGLFLLRETEIRPNEKKATNRVLMEFGKKEAVLQKDCLTIYNDGDSDYSEDFIALTKAFYLRF